MANLLDLMTPEHRERAIKRYKERTAKNDGQKISQEITIISEFGYYYGWQAVQDIRQNNITLEEVNALLEGARKVWYSKLVEIARAGQVWTGSCLSKNPAKTFRQGLRPFLDYLDK